MGRPTGSKSKPGSKKPGPKRGLNVLEITKYTLEEIKGFKTKMLEFFENGQAENISQAAEMAGVPKVRAYNWLRSDAQWAEDLKLGKEVVADKYEQELLLATAMPMVTARIFMLNGLRPDKYRANYKLVMTNPKVEALLEKLSEARQTEPSLPTVETVPTEEVKSVTELMVANAQ